MSPTRSSRHPSTPRRIALCAAALAVTVLPTAYGTAFAGTGSSHAGHSPEIVEAAAVVEPRFDKRGGNEEQAPPPEENEEQGGDQGAEEPPAEQPPAAEEPPAEEPPPAEEGGDNNAGNNGDDQVEVEDNVGGNVGDDAGVAENDPGNGLDGKEEPPPPANAGGNENNGLDVLGTDCTNSQLEPHDGFEEAPRCVDTSFGEVAAEEQSPSLLITEAPEAVGVDQEFTISVSTANLIRDRFLGAAAGGYYLESSFLNAEGIQRGHFHTACRLLESTAEAPDAAPDPEFFVATQDNGGGAAPDEVQITVSGMPAAGTAQCAVWAGDGSHRIPMMQRANQTPAFDAVRITVE
jgi:hypothetical protein